MFTLMDYLYATAKHFCGEIWGSVGIDLKIPRCILGDYIFQATVS